VLRIAEKLGFQTVMMVEVCKNQPTLVFTPKSPQKNSKIPIFSNSAKPTIKSKFYCKPI